MLSTTPFLVVLLILASGLLACSAPTTPHENPEDTSAVPAHHHAFAVHDMTGDGFPDILQHDPDNGVFYVLDSYSNYTVQNAIFLGGAFSVAL